MSFKTEFFTGHWWDDGLYFQTRDEAVAHGAAQGRQFRVVPADDTANYRLKHGKLLPGAEPISPPGGWEKVWEDFKKGGGFAGGIVWEDLEGRRYALTDMHECRKIWYDKIENEIHIRTIII